YSLMRRPAPSSRPPSLHDALPILRDLAMVDSLGSLIVANTAFALPLSIWLMRGFVESLPPDLEEQAMVDGCSRFGAFLRVTVPLDRKSTRLNSSHVKISYAVFCLK